ADAEARFAMVQGAISAIRNIRAEYRVSPKAQVGVVVTGRTTEARRAFEGERETITRLAQIKALRLDGRRASDAGAHAVLADGSEVFVALAGAIDVQQECRRVAAAVDPPHPPTAGAAR